MINEDKTENVNRFLDLVKKSRRGKFKLYIGMIAGVGKTYRMLLDAKSLLQNGINLKIGFIETHYRAETASLAIGLPTIPRKKIFYKGKELEEMDLQTILNIHPEVVIVDELAHTNVPGSKNEKRWQDVVELIEAGINVISAVNIQHIESLSGDIEKITGIEVKERVPDSILNYTDEIVNIDLTADELIERLKEGKIYSPEKVETALLNFFQPEKILQLRELALREVAGQVERKIESEIFTGAKLKPERFLACISSNPETTNRIIHKTARIANYYASKWFVLYVEVSDESFDKINLSDQRHLSNNFNLVTELGGEIIRLKSDDVAKTIFETALEKQVTMIIIGRPRLSVFQIMFKQSIMKKLIRKLSGTKIDILIMP